MNKSLVVFLRERVMHCGCFRFPISDSSRGIESPVRQRQTELFMVESDCFHCNIDLIEAGDVIYWRNSE